MLCKYYLQLGVTTVDITSGDCLDVSNMIKNLENLIVSFSRTDLGGVVRKCGSSIEFVNDAYDALVSHYKENYLKSSGAFAVYTIDNNWNYSKLWECPLDFATFQYTSYVATISCVDNSVAAVIKANKKTKYEFPVSELKSDVLNYAGVQTKREATFYVTGVEATTYKQEETDVELSAPGAWGLRYPSKGKCMCIAWPSTSFATSGFQSTYILLHDRSSGYISQDSSGWSNGSDTVNYVSKANEENDAYIIECLEDVSIKLTIWVKFRDFIGNANYKATNAVVLYSGTREIRTIPFTDIFEYGGLCYITQTVQMYKGEKLFYGFTQCAPDLDYPAYNPSEGWFLFNYHYTWNCTKCNVQSLETEYGTQTEKLLDVFTPQKLAQKILDKMFPQTSTYVRARIDGAGDVLSRTMLIAAETIRNIANQKAYSTFSDFCDFMEAVFGYIYSIQEREDMSAADVAAIKPNTERIVDIVFQHRSALFKNEVIKTLSSANNLNYSINESMVYSAAEIGYPKKDYSNDNNARYEFNFTNYYSTGATLTEETFTLLCPFRSDCYGVEELLIKSKSTEKTDSDDDIFLLVTTGEKDNKGRRVLDKSVSVQNAYTDTVFNAMLAPNKIVQNNKEYIATFTNKLTFASSDANSSAVIDGTAMSADIAITGQMFKAGKISIDTDDMVLPESWDGVVKFELNKKTYQGYLESIDINFAKSGTITYNLIEKCIE